MELGKYSTSWQSRSAAASPRRRGNSSWPSRPSARFLKNYEAQCGYTLFIRTPLRVKAHRGGGSLHTARQITRLQRNLNNR